ncbi:11444_t:CDS:2 [Rhizophagus irregularis]|nr:11444_t:CDS:2 [Rhizophagus irregularis]
MATTIITTIDLVSSPLTVETLKFPIESNFRKDLSKTQNICKNVLKIFQEVKNNKDLIDISLNIIHSGNDLLSEIQQIVDGSQNSSEIKKEIEESPAFQNYNNCISKFETFNHSNPADEVRRDLTKLNDELKVSTDELRDIFIKWKSGRVGWNGKIKKKIKAFAKMANIRKSVTAYEKEIKICEIKSDFVEPLEPPVVVGSTIKGTYVSSLVAIKAVGTFEKSDPKLLDLKKEIDLLKSFSKCHHILDVVISRWGEYNLKTYLSENLKLEMVKKLTIAYGIADALSFIHKQNILHYDIRSENIFLDSQLEAKLSNFRTVNDSPIFMKSITKQTDSRWTPPEKFRGENYTAASEIYSFSLVLWEIINHKIPYHDDTNINQIKTKVLIGINPQPEATVGTPIEYQNIMKQGWDLSSKQRPNVDYMCDILKRLVTIEKYWPDEISRVTDVNDVKNNFLSPNSAIRGDDASSIHTNCSTDGDYISPAAWKIFKEIEKRNQSPEAKFWVGLYYLKGYHDKGSNGKADPRASKYLYQAAKEGHPDAQYWYSISILNYGLIAKEQKDEEQFKVANDFLRKAADQNHYYALKKLGSIIRKGEYGNISNTKLGNDMIRRARTLVSKSSLETGVRPSFDIRPSDKLARHSTVN